MTAAGDGQVGRIPSGRFRELGPVNWAVAKLAARRMRVPEMHLFTTLGQRQLLFWTWSIYGGLLTPFAVRWQHFQHTKLPRSRPN